MKRIKMNRSNCVRPIVLISILFIALFSGSSCQRTPDVPQCCYDCSCGSPCSESNAFTYPYTDTLYQSDSFLSYWFFPVGSWWVYKRVDTKAVIYDTARVTEQKRGIACDCQLLGDVCRERAWIVIEHTETPMQKPNEFKMGVTLDTDLRIDWVFAESGTSVLGGVVHMTWPFVAAEESHIYTIKYEQTPVFSTTKYTFFNPVTYFYQNPNIPADTMPSNIYKLVKNIGLVYFYHQDYSEWELVDYHIAKP
ncbi:hypothetical protein GC194_07470 [bacterium]|nr:hypothetical protein [bacterium]